MRFRIDFFILIVLSSLIRGDKYEEKQNNDVYINNLVNSCNS